MRHPSSSSSTVRCCSLLASGMLLLLWSQLADCSRLLQTTTIPDGYVQVDAIFESRLFANGNVALVTLDDAVTTTLQALAADGPVVVVEKSESAVLGTCDTADYTKVAFELCIRTTTKIHMWAAPDMDTERLELVALEHVRTYLTTDFNTQQQGSIYIIYEYPITVQASVLLKLQGAHRIMAENEIALFLQNFQAGFEGIMLVGQYNYVDADVLLQFLGIDEKRRQRRYLQQQQEQAELESNPNEFNMVELLVRGQCFGPSTCHNDNFRNFLHREMQAFTVPFLTLLKTIGPADAILYFDRVLSISLAQSQQSVPDLKPDFVIEIVDANEEDVPSWVWILLAVVVAILACASGWVYYRMQGRSSNKAKTILPHDPDDDDDDNNKMMEPQQEQEEAPGADDQPPGDDKSDNVDDDFSDLGFDNTTAD